MAVTYEVQGRRTVRDADGKPREVVRLDKAADRTVAFAIAETMGAERLTAWVFEADRRSSGPPTYTLLGIVRAARS